MIKTHTQTVVRGKVKYRLVPEKDYKRMIALHQKKRRQEAPALVDIPGNLPAVAFAEATIARTIVRRREALGWTQRRLADAAGVRPEVLNRAERAVVVPSVRTLTKIEIALHKAETQDA